VDGLFCDVCHKPGAHVVRTMYANIILAQGFFCSYACAREGLRELSENAAKSTKCLEATFGRHVQAQCDCIRHDPRPPLDTLDEAG